MPLLKIKLLFDFKAYIWSQEEELVVRHWNCWNSISCQQQSNIVFNPNYRWWGVLLLDSAIEIRSIPSFFFFFLFDQPNHPIKTPNMCTIKSLFHCIHKIYQYTCSSSPIGIGVRLFFFWKHGVRLLKNIASDIFSENFLQFL